MKALRDRMPLLLQSAFAVVASSLIAGNVHRLERKVEVPVSLAEMEYAAKGKLDSAGHQDVTVSPTECELSGKYVFDFASRYEGREMKGEMACAPVQDPERGYACETIMVRVKNPEFRSACF